MSDVVDKAAAWDAATAVPPKAQREIDALRTVLKAVLSMYVMGDSLERIRDRFPTFMGEAWDDILADPDGFVDRHPYIDDMHS